MGVQKQLADLSQVLDLALRRIADLEEQVVQLQSDYDKLLGRSQDLTPTRRVRKLVLHAEATFDWDKKAAESWLAAGHVALGGTSPLVASQLSHEGYEAAFGLLSAEMTRRFPYDWLANETDRLLEAAAPDPH